MLGSPQQRVTSELFEQNITWCQNLGATSLAEFRALIRQELDSSSTTTAHPYLAAANKLWYRDEIKDNGTRKGQSKNLLSPLFS